MSESYIIPIFVYGTLGFMALLAIIFVMLIMQNKRRYRYRNEKAEREYQFRKELLQTQIELQEYLLNEVSQEIHDNVAQVLSVVKLNLYAVNNVVTDDTTIHKLKTSSELLDKAINDLRNISHRNNADLLQRIGLKEALRKELDYVDGLKGQSSHLEIQGEYYSMDSAQELMIYRIAQEAIHNCIKHARANDIKVLLSYESRHFTLQISDNGVGFNTEDAASYTGIGIGHMKHRAKVLNSELEISSLPLQGTTVTLKIPNKYG